MEKTYEIRADGFRLRITRAHSLVHIECERDSPQVFLKTSDVLTLKQSKKLEAILREANRAEGSSQ
jgi:hypothetical protein